MNNYFDNTNCSRTSVESYLLNNMTTDEETLFQEHLLACSSCREYLNTLRNLAGVSSNEMQEPEGTNWEIPESTVMSIKPAGMSGKLQEPAVMSIKPADMSGKLQEPVAQNRKKKKTPVISLSTKMRWFLAAACLIPVCGIFLYKFLREPGIPHTTQIMHQNKASVDYAETPVSTFSLDEVTVIGFDTLRLLSPPQPVYTVNPAEEEITFRWNRESDFRLRLEADGKTIAEIDSIGMSCTIDSSLATRHEHLDWTLTIEGKELKGTLHIQM